MSYLFELRTVAGAAYVVAAGDNRQEAFAQARVQLGMDEEDEVEVLAVHTLH